MAFTNNQPLDGESVPISSVYRKEDNTFPALASEPGGYQDANNNQSSAALMSFFRSLIVQKKSAATGSGGKTLTCTFDNPTQAGNSIVVSMGMGEVEGAGIVLAVTDTQGNSYSQSQKASQSTTLESAIFLTTGPTTAGGGIVGGNDTITITISGGSSSNTAISCEIYEVWGLIGFAGALDQTATGSNAGSTSVSTGAVTPILPNEMMIMAIAAAGGTITPGTYWTLDSGTLTPTGGNLVSFGSQSRPHSTTLPITPSATLGTSNAWAACCATFKSISVPVQGTVIANAGTNLNTSLLALESGGNLATLAGIVSSSKAATKAATNDIVDLATLLALAGASGDANTVNSFMGRLTKIRDLLSATLTVAGSGNFTVVQGTGSNLHAQLDSGSTTAVTQATASNLNAQVQGVSASGASNSGNPEKIGGVFNTTQPTVTNGQTVDAQYTARGAAIVATGVDTFNATIQSNASINNAQVSGTAVSVNNGTTDAGTQRVTLSSDSTGQVKLATGANTIGALTANQSVNVAQVAGTTTDTNSGNKSAGTQRVVLATDQPTMTNPQPVSQNGTWTAVPNAATSGGSTPSHTMSAASTNATSLKASAGMVYGLSISNANAAARYFKLYNKASAPTVGTDTPVLTLQIPANATVIRAYPVGLALGTGIAWAATTGIADSDTGSVGSNDLSIDIDYK